jgi:hypothetical protein
MLLFVVGIGDARAASPIVDVPTEAAPRTDPTTLLATLTAFRTMVVEPLFGPVPESAIGITAWGYVGLPLVKWLTPEELALEWTREDLVAPEQREKAIAAWGPSRDGVPVYTHFTGSDAPDSDRWATPATVGHLLRLLSGWFDHCAATLGPAERCTVQVGDLAWYNGKEPDPLGHRDHSTGRCADVRLFRSDGSHYEAWWNRPDDRPGRPAAYDPDRTAAFLSYALVHAPIDTAYFNDPLVRAKAPGVKPAPGHDDHVHLCFRP